MLRIEEATVADIPDIIQVAELSWWPTYREILTPDQIRYMLDNIYKPDLLAAQINGGEQVYLVVRDESGCHGFASYGSHKEDPARYKIHKLYVTHLEQGKGCGRLLVGEILRRLQAMKVLFVELNVNRHNPARAFYERNGFQVVGEEDIPIGPYWMNDFVMRRPLARLR